MLPAREQERRRHELMEPLERVAGPDGLISTSSLRRYYTPPTRAIGRGTLCHAESNPTASAGTQWDVKFV